MDRNRESGAAAPAPGASLSARRAWIEILVKRALTLTMLVALRKESVDRNFFALSHSVPALKVALRKESVDRNIILPKQLDRPARSLSARRAWIEITGR